MDGTIDLSEYEISREELELLVERDNPVASYAETLLSLTRPQATA